MPANIRFIHANEYIKATAEGQINLEAARELLIEIASASDPAINYSVFLDVRKTQPELSITDLWYLASELSNFPKDRPRKTAILCPVEQFDYTGFFALCAHNRGFHLGAFTSFEAAIEWLLEEGVDT